MNFRCFFALLAGAVLIAPTATKANAQGVLNAAPASVRDSLDSARQSSPRPPIAVPASRYDSQALRFESRWGNAKIIRGADATVLGTTGWFHGVDVVKLVETSPAAVREALVYKSNSRSGSAVAALGAVTFAVGLIVTSNASSNAASPVMIIAGAGAMAWGAQHLNRASAALSRSLWWYNRDLTH